jgi:hypothetical protein
VPSNLTMAESAFAACPNYLGSNGDLGGTRPERYDCEHTNNMQDAMHITTTPPEPEKCAQICLPRGLFGIAQRHGVVQGYCSDSGFDDFQYSSAHAGVKVRSRGPCPCFTRPHACVYPHARGADASALLFCCASLAQYNVFYKSLPEVPAVGAD